MRFLFKMPVNQERLNTKLTALQNKDVAELVSGQITIPFLSKPYNSQNFQTWLNKRITRLQEVANKTDAEILAIRNTLYNGLNNAAKDVADKIIAKERFTFPSNLSSATYDRLIGIHLITFVLE